MPDWGAYDPERFSGFSQSDLLVDAQTRKHFSRAVCGVPDSYWELNEDRHFWAMSVPMRAIFARMPTRYPYYIGSISTAVSVPTVRTLDTTGNQQCSGQFGAKETAAKGRASRSSKRMGVMTESVTVADTHHTADDVSANSGTVFATSSAGNRDPTEVIRSQSVKKPGSSKTENVRSQSVSTNDTPEDAESLTDSEPATEVSSGSATWTRQTSAPRQIIVTHKVLSKKARSKESKRMKRGGSVFSRSAASSATAVPSMKLKERVEQCKSWRLAFRLALCTLFKYDELKNHTATQADSTRITLAADLVRDYCRSRSQPEPVTRDFHNQYCKTRKYLRPYYN